MKLQPTADLFGDNSLQCDFLSDTIPSTNNFFSTLKRSQSHSPTNWLTPIIISKAVKSSVKCIVFFFSMFRCYAPVTISMDDWWAKQKDPLELFLKGWENIYIKACVDMNTTPYYVLSQLYNYSPRAWVSRVSRTRVTRNWSHYGWNLCNQTAIGKCKYWHRVSVQTRNGNPIQSWVNQILIQENIRTPWTIIDKNQS